MFEYHMSFVINVRNESPHFMNASISLAYKISSSAILKEIVKEFARQKNVVEDSIAILSWQQFETE